jgi:hypothetical protein
VTHRHVLLLGTAADGDGGGMVVHHVDLGPAKVNDTMTARSPD